MTATPITPEMIRAAAKALFVMQCREDVRKFDLASYATLSDAATREATNALTAALPLIEQAVRQQVARQIEALEYDRPTVKDKLRAGYSLDYCAGHLEGITDAARIARGGAS